MIREMPKILTLFIKFLVIFGLFASPALAQGVNPFARPEAPKEPEREPQQQSTPAQAILPPAQVAPPQLTILDYQLELQVLQLVGLRNDVAVIRAPESTYFLRNGDEFMYNGGIYEVDIKGKTFKLLVDDAGPSIIDEETGEQLGKEPLEVYVKEIGRTLSPAF